MIRFLIELIMFGCTVFTIIHVLKTLQQKKHKKKMKTPKLSDLKGKDFSKYIDDLKKDLY